MAKREIVALRPLVGPGIAMYGRIKGNRMKLFLEAIKKTPKVINAKYAWKVVMRSRSTGGIMMEGRFEYRYKRDANKAIKWIQKDQLEK